MLYGAGSKHLEPSYIMLLGRSENVKSEILAPIRKKNPCVYHMTLG